MENNPYDKFIADAAREFIELRNLYNKTKTIAYLEKYKKADRKLINMVEAEKHKWNPNEFKSELE